MRSFFVTVLIIGLAQTFAAQPSESKTKTDKEGWKLLFDGKSLAGWRSFKKETAPNKGWVAEKGMLRHLPKGGGGDIITDEAFDDFDLRWEWQVVSGANSGLKYFITETRSSAIGHEYQLIDDTKHPDALRGPKWQTSSFYDVLPPVGKTLKPVGEWNQSRIVVKGNHVEHWLNDQKVLEYELGSPEVKAAVARSKFKNVQGFGEKVHGHILLQDHGDEIAFRNIRIKEFGK
jgi:hypothetical protein